MPPPESQSTNLLLEDLFEEAKRPVIDEYATWEGALDAVASRRKAMEWETWSAAEIEQEGDQIDFQAMAASRGLTVVQLPDDFTLNVPLVRAYALYPENIWRASAHLALLATNHKALVWSKEAEELQSWLLGYTEEERRVWHAYNDWRQLGWNGLTIYFFMNQRSEQHIRSLASRCLDPTLGSENIVAAFPMWGMAMRKDGLSRLPPGLHAARAAVPHVFIETLYGPVDSRPQTTVQSRVLSGETIDQINRALISSIQFLTRDGWS